MRRLSTALLLVLVALPCWAQDRSGSGISTAGEGRPGIGIDKFGNQVVDPTKNVLDLVLAAVKRLDDLNDAMTKRADDLRVANTRYQDALRDAETRRINELSAQKQTFDLEMARVIRANQDSSTLLLAGQLKEVKTDLSDRTTKLEVFANEQRGRASASGDTIGWIVAAIGLLIGLAGLILAFTTRARPHV